MAPSRGAGWLHHAVADTQLRASCTSASWERGLQWAAFLAPAFTAGPLIGTSVPLALSAAVAAWLLGRMVIAMVHAYQGERRDQAMAVVVGGADRWAQVLTASQQAADDARRRMHGRPPLQWLFGYFHYIPGRQSVSRRIARLTGDTTPP